MECLHSIGEDLSGRFDVPTRVQGIDPLKSTKKIYTVYLYARHGLAVGLLNTATGIKTFLHLRFLETPFVVFILNQQH